jgi:aspartate racemase
MKKIGIIGGLGPSATIDLYGKITANTPATKDQEHLRIIIDSHPQIPDRTAALKQEGQSPKPALIESIQLLQNAECELIACPCNTAHIFLREIQKEIKFKLIDMIEETCKFLEANQIKKAGLLSTSGTANSKIYQETAQRFGIEIITPDAENIAKEMEAIYGTEGIKAGIKFEKSPKNKQLFQEVISSLTSEKVEAIIMGCTEIPLCLDENDSNLTLIDPTLILAKAIIREAKA